MNRRLRDGGSSGSEDFVLINLKEQKKNAQAFIKRWEGRGNERQDSHSFWIDLLESVYGIEEPTGYIKFEDTVKMDKTSFIDGYIAKTRVLIEQKSRTKDLSKAIVQSDGSKLTPFQQAKRYATEIGFSKYPRWIVVSNFQEFRIYDMEQPNSEPKIVRLEDLDKEAYRLEFLIDKTNEHLEREMKVSIEAGEIVGEIYEGLLKQYINPDSLHAINQLVVRLVFCLYAEDAGIFGHKMMFHDYLARFSSRDFRRGLIDLFSVLNTPIEERVPYLDEELLAFPYVNGGMFAENNLEIPKFTDDLRELILEHASSSFDWSEISPTIFGAVFESTLNPETRRSGGMHYTSIENIHKVIDPLFLDELKDELNEIRQFKQFKTVEQRAKQFQSKLSSLTFFDPACGSGNFLTETYISLRRLENEAIKLYMGDAVALDLGQELVKVKLNQFYGIEINDFAVSVAKTALWIAESQMLEETKDIVFANIDFLPLKSYTNIVEGNALEIDWETVVSKDKLSYIIGNPPFIGARLMSKEQKNSLLSVFDGYKGVGNLDFVCGWYINCAKIMKDSSIEAALVSTNSITQGEQASILWKILMEEFDIKINFAYQTFQWTSEAKQKAAVYCVIVGFSNHNNDKKILFDTSNQTNKVDNINGYLVDAPNVFIENRTQPISNVNKMVFGSMPNDGGFLSNYSDEEKNNIVQRYPESEKFFKRIYGAQEFINNKIRWALWLYQTSPSEWRKIPPIAEAVKNVQENRSSSKRESTKKLADIPYLFGEIRQPEGAYLLVPRVSSENRRYIPMGFMGADDLASDAVQIVPDATLYDFGILTSNVHMAWMRTVAGRLKSDYRYSAKIVYNNFPWPEVTEAQKEKISKTAQAILDARALHPESSLADLYDEIAMPAELRRAHQANDKAVMEAYDMTKIVDGKKTWLTESETVARLFEMYEEITK